MEDVEFLEQGKSSRSTTNRKVAAMSRMLIRVGLVKTARQADILLAVFACVCLAIAVVLYGFNFGWFVHASVPYRQDIPPNILKQLPQSTQNYLPNK